VLHIRLSDQIKLVIFQAMLAWAGIAIAADDSASEKMGLGTHAQLIEKLEAVLQGQSNLTKATKLHHRLGDLYAERARLQQMEEIKQGCTTLQCSKAKSDRSQAIRHYDAALKDLENETRSVVMVQKAYLHEGLEQFDAAKQIYDQIIKEGKARHELEFIGHGYIGRGEYHFRKAEFAKAYTEYDKGTKIAQTKRKGHAQYRMAWCKLNTGDVKSAQRHLERLLEQPTLFKNDTSFQEDVTRDLASFYARANVGPREIEKLKRLSPPGGFNEILHHLAEETDRLGNKQGSIYVWALIPVDDSTPFGAAEKHLQIARLSYEDGKKEKAAAELKKASLVWNEQKCGKEENEKCKELQKQIRNFIVNWNKGDKVEPDKYLLSAYLSYSAIFPTDYEMHYWAGQLAKDLKNFKQSADSFRLAAIHGKTQPKVLNGALLNQIEAAETTGSVELRLRAYGDYLELNPTGTEVFKVKYQIAHIHYEQKDFKFCADEFHALAVVQQKGENRNLQVQSADLALDALAALKDDERLETWGQEFAKVIPAKSTEYLSISRKASLNLMKAFLVSGNPGDARRAKDKAKAFALEGASRDEKTAYLKNLIVIGEKLEDLNLIRTAATDLAKVAQDENDVQMALSRVVWTHEMELNFDAALAAAKKAKFPELKNGQRALKLAVLSEFAGRDPRPFYTEALKDTKDAQQAARIRQKIVRRSNNPWKELAAQKSALSRFPDLYAETLFETYARKADDKQAARELLSRKILSTPSGQNLARIFDFKNLQEFNRDIQSHRMNTSSEQRLAKSLQERIRFIEKADKLLVKASQHQDLSRQVFMLGILARENRRLAKEISAFPIPRHVRGAQRDEYKNQLALQSEKFAQQASLADDKIDEFFGNRQAVRDMENVYMNSEYPFKGLVRQELLALRLTLGSHRGAEKIASILGDSKDLPSASEVASARDTVRKNPFNTRALGHYKDLQEQLGRHELAMYLTARIEKMNTQGSSL
jgi:hypothetical protein